MSGILWLALVMRWAHILAAIVALGGSVFLRLVYLPAVASTLPEEPATRLRERILSRWKRIVHTCILLFLVSGFYNYLVVTGPAHKGQPLYHALFGVKFLLALAVFYLALALTSSSRFGAGLRKKGPVGLTLLVLFAVLIVLISGYLKVALAA